MKSLPSLVYTVRTIICILYEQVIDIATQALDATTHEDGICYFCSDTSVVVTRNLG